MKSTRSSTRWPRCTAAVHTIREAEHAAHRGSFGNARAPDDRGDARGLPAGQRRPRASPVSGGAAASGWTEDEVAEENAVLQRLAFVPDDKMEIKTSAPRSSAEIAARPPRHRRDACSTPTAAAAT